MNIKEAIEKRILELKSKPLTVETKLEIQKLQQLLDEPNASENLNKNNSANSLKLKAK